MKEAIYYGMSIMGLKCEMSVFFKPALPVRWISPLFGTQPPSMVYHTKTDFVLKIT
jgi:hypothetical protein